MSDEQEARGWHGWRVVKDIPAALLAGLILQLLAAVWWASGVDTRLAYQDLRLEYQASRLDRLEKADLEVARVQAQMNERLARIEEKNAAQVEILQRIERALALPPGERR